MFNSVDKLLHRLGIELKYAPEESEYNYILSLQLTSNGF